MGTPHSSRFKRLESKAFPKASSIRVFVLAVIIVALCQHHVSAEICNRVVAIVNDEVITLHELNKKIKEMTGLSAEDLSFQDQDRYLETRRSILELLIDERISQEKIRELRIKVYPKEIDAAIEKIKKDNKWTHEDLMERLNGEGLTYEKYRENIKKDLERLRLINFEVKSKIIIREKQITQYYQEHKEEFSSGGKVHLAGIFLLRNNPGIIKGKDILARLRQGEDFGELASRFSQGPGADEGGDLGVFQIAHLDPELRKIVEDMAEGGFSDLIMRPNGIQIIKVIEKQEAKLKPLEDVSDAIYGILFREEVDKRYMSWIKGLRESSYTKIIF